MAIVPAPRSTMRGVRVQGAVDVVEYVDGLDLTEAGELLLKCSDGKVVGIVFVEAGRVCWAAAPGLARRLVDLLRERHEVSSDDMERLFHACRESKEPLGEALVREGIVSPDELRAALYQHAIESLVAMEPDAVEMCWRERPGGGYKPTFTFSTAEILTALSRARHPDDAAAADVLWRRVAEDGDGGVVLLRSEDSGRPVPVGGQLVDLTASALTELASGVTAVVDLAMVIDSSRRVVVAQGASSGLTIVAEGPLTAVVAAGPKRWARIVSRAQRGK